MCIVIAKDGVASASLTRHECALGSFKIAHVSFSAPHFAETASRSQPVRAARLYTYLLLFTDSFSQLL
jgi:hypothetical protein